MLLCKVAHELRDREQHAVLLCRVIAVHEGDCQSNEVYMG